MSVESRAKKRKSIIALRKKNAKEKIDRKIPLPLFLYSDVPDNDGVVARYMFPAGGTIEQGTVVVEEFEGGDSVEMELSIDSGEPIVFFAYKVPDFKALGINTLAGSMLTIRSKNLYAKKFWVSFSWAPK